MNNTERCGRGARGVDPSVPVLLSPVEAQTETHTAVKGRFIFYPKASSPLMFFVLTGGSQSGKVTYLPGNLYIFLCKTFM